MSSPKIFCKSGYITSSTHVINILEYAGNKIAAQSILFKDGTTLEVDSETRIALTDAQQRDVSCIHLEYKDGGSKRITYKAYRKLTSETQDSITVRDLEVVDDEEILQTNEDGKKYHRTQDLDFFKYMNYIEARPGVEKTDGHGLFGLLGNVSIEEANAMAIEYDASRKWSHIISLETEGAKRTGFDRRHMWEALILSKAPQIAKAYNISLENLVINCAYHGNTDNPHVHLLFYSKDTREGFIKGGKEGLQAASDKLKSMLMNDIYKNDLAPLKERKTLLREDMKEQMLQSLKNIERKDYSHTDLSHQLLRLSDTLRELPGKKVYAYLPTEVKAQVNEILRQIINTDKDVYDLYAAHLDIQKEFVSQYVMKPEKIQASMQEFEQRFFEPGKTDLNLYHNAIVKAALSADAMAATEPPVGARATKGEERHSTAPVAGTSTEGTYFASDEDIPSPSDWDAPPESEQDWYADIDMMNPAAGARATKGEEEYSTAPEFSASTVDTAYFASDEDVPPPYMVIGAYEQKDKLLEDHHQYQMHAVCNSLVFGLARLLLSQSETANQNTSPDRRRRKKRFAHRKPRGRYSNIAHYQSTEY